MRLSGPQPWPPSQHWPSDPGPGATSPISYQASSEGQKAEVPEGLPVGRTRLPPTRAESPTAQRAAGGRLPALRGRAHGAATPSGDTGMCQPVLLHSELASVLTLPPEPTGSRVRRLCRPRAPHRDHSPLLRARLGGSGAYPGTSSSKDAEPGLSFPITNAGCPWAAGLSTVRSARLCGQRLKCP